MVLSIFQSCPRRMINYTIKFLLHMPLLHTHQLLIIQSLQEAPSYSSVSRFSQKKQELNKTKTIKHTYIYKCVCVFMYVCMCVCMYILCFLSLKRLGEYIRIGRSPHRDEQKEIILGMGTSWCFKMILSHHRILWKLEKRKFVREKNRYKIFSHFFCWNYLLKV